VLAILPPLSRLCAAAHAQVANSFFLFTSSKKPLRYTTMALEFVDNFDWHDSDLEDIPPTLSPIPSLIRGRYRPPSDEPKPSAAA
jgi:hypothetical protein